MVDGEQDSTGGALRGEVDVDASEDEVGEVLEWERGSTWEGVEEGAGGGSVGASGAGEVGGEGPTAKGDVGSGDVGEEHEASDEAGGALELPGLTGDEDNCVVLRA